ncbi:MAG: hypothetical protein D4S02_13790 [Rhodocyclaceae bacterium]|nr:MAG: hypothetical protein D4S02_13790 [Rhodocyclaceae bacterium]
MSYQERLALAMSQSELYKSATDLARAMGCTPQAVSLVLSGASKSFGATNHSKASDLLNILPTWLASGEGPMRGTSHTPQQGTESPVGDPVLDDLNVLEPEDADVWRAQIRAAATKIKREKSKQLTETSDFAPKPPQREQQQPRMPQPVDLEIEAAVPQVKP